MFQTEIAKRLNAIIGQILPFLSQDHHQQIASAVERAKQVTMTELNAIIGVSLSQTFIYCYYYSIIFNRDTKNREKEINKQKRIYTV